MLRGIMSVVVFIVKKTPLLMKIWFYSAEMYMYEVMSDSSNT